MIVHFANLIKDNGSTFFIEKGGEKYHISSGENFINTTIRGYIAYATRRGDFKPNERPTETTSEIYGYFVQNSTLAHGKRSTFHNSAATVR